MAFWSLIATVGNGIIQHGIENRASQEETRGIDLARSDRQQYEERVLAELTNARNNWNPYAETGQIALEDLQRILQGDFSKFYTSPGYEFRQQEAAKANQRLMSSQGALNTGQQQIDLLNRSQNVASQEYQNYLNTLFGGVQVGAQGAQGQSAADVERARFLERSGDAMANLRLERGYAKAGSYRRHGGIAQNVYEDFMAQYSGNPMYQKGNSYNPGGQQGGSQYNTGGYGYGQGSNPYNSTGYWNQGTSGYNNQNVQGDAYAPAYRGY